MWVKILGQSPLAKIRRLKSLSWNLLVDSGLKFLTWNPWSEIFELKSVAGNSWPMGYVNLLTEIRPRAEMKSPGSWKLVYKKSPVVLGWSGWSKKISSSLRLSFCLLLTRYSPGKSPPLGSSMRFSQNTIRILVRRPLLLEPKNLDFL